MQHITSSLTAGILDREAPLDRGVLVRARGRLNELLVLLLARAKFTGKRKKIKAFTYQIISQVMVTQENATGRVENRVRIQVDGQPWVWSQVDPLLTPERQTHMLRRILEENSEGARDTTHHDSRLQYLDDKVRDIDIDENDTQKMRRKVRKNLNPRQFLDWDTHDDAVFVSKFDITQQVMRDNTGLEGKMLERAVAQMWDRGSCFPLDLYCVGSEKLTKAEIFIRRLRRGYSWREVTEWFNYCRAVQPPEERQVSIQWKTEAVDRAMEWNAGA